MKNPQGGKSCSKAAPRDKRLVGVRRSCRRIRSLEIRVKRRNYSLSKNGKTVCARDPLSTINSSSLEYSGKTPYVTPCIERRGRCRRSLGCIMQSLESAICLVHLSTRRKPPSSPGYRLPLASWPGCKLTSPPALLYSLLQGSAFVSVQPLMLSRAASISHRIWDWKEFKAIFDEQEVEDVVSRSSNGERGVCIWNKTLSLYSRKTVKIIGENIREIISNIIFQFLF